MGDKTVESLRKHRVLGAKSILGIFLQFPVKSSVTMSDKEKDKEKEKEKTESKPGDLGLLEEDDEFEEFPAEDWTNREEDPSDVNVWEDNWDDDNVEDDFSVQLKSELESQGVAMEQS